MKTKIYRSASRSRCWQCSSSRSARAWSGA